MGKYLIMMILSVKWWLVFFLIISGMQELLAQGLKLSSPDNFVNCTSSGKYTVNVKNESTRGVYQEGTFGILWGDGEKIAGLTYAQVSLQTHEYKRLGNYILNFFANPVGGGVADTVKIVVVNGKNQPAIGIETDQTGTYCVGGEVEFHLTNFNTNSRATTYLLDYGDGNKEALNYDDLVSADGRIKYIYKKSHCELKMNDGIVIRVEATNECNSSKTATLENTYVVKPPTPAFSLPEEGCTWQKIVLTNETATENGLFCNQKVDNNYTWEIEKQDHSGFDTVEVENPVIQYTIPGEYRVILHVDNGFCSGEGLEKKITIIERVIADFELSPNVKNSVVCSGEPVIFTNRSTGDKRRHEWTVRPISAISGHYEHKEIAGTSNLQATFDYGEFEITLHEWNHCSDSIVKAVILVKKEPEVMKLKEIEPLCPAENGGGDGILRFNNTFVAYKWYNNEAKPKWSVTGGTAGGWAWANGTGAGSEYPQIKFMKPGTYTVTVQLNGVDCGAGAGQLQQSWVVTVYDPLLTADITVQDGKKTVCEGADIIRFVNRSSANQTIQYNWTIQKGGSNARENIDYAFVSGNKTSKEPQLKFLTYGDYTVIANLEVHCNSARKQFEFHVKKEPEVAKVVVALSPICPAVQGSSGMLDMTGKVAYTWYNDTEHRLTWEVTPANGWEWAPGYKATDLYPQIKFTKKGTYTVKVRLAGVGCAASPSEQSWTLEVYDPEIRGNITLSEEQKSVCEGSRLQFVNTIDAVHPDYVWQISREEGDRAGDYTMTPNANDKLPAITLNRFGTYRIRVNVSAQCAQLSREFIVVVRKDPEITAFDELGNDCKPAVLNLRGKIFYEWYNNTEHRLNWTVTPAGGWEFLNNSGKSEYPLIKFTEPGTYRVKVKLEGTACSGTKLEQEREITILDPAVKKDIRIEGEEGNSVIICEQGKVSFVNATDSKIPVTYEWKITSAKEIQPGRDYVFTRGSVTDQAPEIQFKTYGEYSVEVSLITECNQDNPTTDRFNVTVQRDPEVYLADLGSICPSEALVMNEEKVTYLWNDNKKKEVFWEVKRKDGAFAEGVTLDHTALYPEIHFTLPGTYVVAVHLEQPAGCGGSALSAEKEVIVHDPAMELKVSPEMKTLCQGETFAFTNESTAAEAETYLWSVTPVGETPADGWSWIGKNTDKAPAIRFSHYGEYKVKVVMTANGDCDMKSQEMTVTVRQDPSVELKNFPDMCPGELTLAEESSYTWRGNTPQVDWRIEVPEGTNLQTPAGLYPTVHFTEPGEYKVVATLESVGCPGDHLKDSVLFTIYPPDIKVGIVVPEQVEEGKQITVENHTAGQGLVWKWSMPEGNPEGYRITPDNVPNPVVGFTKHGHYRLHADIHGTCADSVKDFDIDVIGVPEFHLAAQLPNVCAGSVVSMKEHLTYDAKGAEITARWTITPAGNGEYEFNNAGGAEDLLPDIHFLKSGQYTLRLEAEAEFGGKQVVTTHVDVLSTEVNALTLTDIRGCTKDRNKWQLVLENRSVGDSLEYHWEILPAKGWHYLSGNGQERQPSIEITEAGDYTVNLKIGNICRSDVAGFKIHAFTNPVIDPIEEIRDVCEKGYVFEGKELVKVEENGDPLNEIKWTITPSGFHFGNGMDAGTLQPDLTFEGKENPYHLKLEVKNGCGDVIAEEFTILVDEFKEITPARDTQLCALTGPMLLSGDPHGGVWTTIPSEMIQQQNGEYYFNPYKDENGSFEVMYTYGHKSCMAFDTIDIVVHRLPVVEAKENLERCVNLEPLTLQPGSPEGGVWKFRDRIVTEFDPSVAGVGDFKLEYWYTDPVTRCPNVDSIKMTVHPLPNPDFTASLEHCRNTDSLFVPVELGAGNRFEWDFGDGNKGIGSEGAILHRYADPGFYKVALTAISGHGCIDHSDTLKLEVYNQPPQAEFDVNKIKGCAPLDVKFSVDQEKYTSDPHAHLSYSWIFGNGRVSQELQPDPDSVTYLPPLYDTTYQVSFKVFNICGDHTVTKDIRVLSSPKARFVMMPEEGCDPLEVNFANLSTGNGNNYSWTFGDGATSTDKEPVHVFRTGKKATPYYIEMVAHNECATTYFRDTITVKPNSLSVKFKMSDKYICAGDTVCFTNFSSDTAVTILNQFWDFGDGQYSSAWDTCHRFDKTGRLEVSVTLDNGCSKAGYTDTVVVYAIPDLKIESETQLCQQDTFHFELKSDQPLKNIAWELGDDTKENAMRFGHVYEGAGFFDVRVNVVSAEIASCPASAAKTVETWPKPDIEIIPLDTVACPPFLYQPEIENGTEFYYVWDYGDGTPPTSEMQHLYENDTNYILDYDIGVTVESNRGCRQEYTGHIRINNGPKVAWKQDISYGRPEKVRFINLSRDYTEAIWYLPDGNVVSSPEDQELVFEEEDTYPVALTVVNEYGCRDSIYMDYRSYMGGLYFPNTFIPHSANPRVNRFNGIGMGLKEYHLEIFDLYGNKVWETRALSLGMPSEGWDGRNRNGKLLPQGMYIWRAEAIFYSEDVWTGKNNRSGKPQTTQGTVLMLKE